MVVNQTASVALNGILESLWLCVPKSRKLTCQALRPAAVRQCIKPMVALPALQYRAWARSAISFDATSCWPKETVYVDNVGTSIDCWRTLSITYSISMSWWVQFDSCFPQTRCNMIRLLASYIVTLFNICKFVNLHSLFDYHIWDPAMMLLTLTLENSYEGKQFIHSINSLAI